MDSLNPSAKRLTSGIPRLDFILKGGFLRGGAYSVQGPPGSGKTILANQLCFNTARREGKRSIFVTMVTESQSDMIFHLEELKFFERDQVAQSVLYLSGREALKDGGLPGLLKMIRDAVKEHSAAVLVIDGSQRIESLARDVTEFHDFIYDLKASCRLLKCTTLLLRTVDHTAVIAPENIVTDGVIEMGYKLVGPRAVRELTVHKFRGSDHLVGRHEVEITYEGVCIHPRTEVQFNEPAESAMENRERMSFGIPGLDAMMQGGVWSSSSSCLLGAPGTGKTSIGLSFLIEGARRGQRGIYFGFYEPPPRLIEKAESVGIPLAKYVKEGLIDLMWQPPLENMMDSLAEQLLEKVRRDRPQRSRMFIDGFEGFRTAAVYGDRMPRFLSALSNQLRVLDVTHLISVELNLFNPKIGLPAPEFGSILENVISLRYVELRSQIYRLIMVMKTRDSEIDSTIRELKITSKGVEVAEGFESAEAILSGTAHLLSEAQRAAAKAEGKKHAS